MEEYISGIWIFKERFCLWVLKVSWRFEKHFSRHQSSHHVSLNVKKRWTSSSTFSLKRKIKDQINKNASKSHLHQDLTFSFSWVFFKANDIELIVLGLRLRPPPPQSFWQCALFFEEPFKYISFENI